jgi:hypothetical protein
MAILNSQVQAPSLPRVEQTSYGIEHHVISDEAFEELLEYLKEESGYEFSCDH